MAKKDYQDFKLKINMKTILLYEEMSGKSFYEVGGEDIMLLIYCALVVNNDLSITKNHFDIIFHCDTTICYKMLFLGRGFLGDAGNKI